MKRPFHEHRRCSFFEGDAKNIELVKELLTGCDHFVAAAAMTGGISYFHGFAYDLPAENERITTGAIDFGHLCSPASPIAKDHRAVIKHGL